MPGKNKDDFTRNDEDVPAPDDKVNLPFTIAQIRAAVPSHLFLRSTTKSFYYLFRDILFASIMYWIATKIDTLGLPLWLRLPIWAFWCFWQGAIFTGLWVIAHECGHQSFSPYKFLNDTVGLIFHSLLLVPYHPWRISHSQHHKNTNNLDKDEVFVPPTKQEYYKPTLYSKLRDTFDDSPLFGLANIVMMYVIGWQLYLATHVTGRKYDKHNDHFNPSSPMFDQKRDRRGVIISDIALGVVLLGIMVSCYYFSFITVFKYYLLPYCWVNFWLLTITLLQHTDTYIDHARGEDWNFLKGALFTVDRNYGIFNYLHHNIGDSHVAHHLFSQMPHYNAIQATEYIKPILGKYYLSDNSSWLKAIWRAYRECLYVEPQSNGYHWVTRTKLKQ